MYTCEGHLPSTGAKIGGCRPLYLQVYIHMDKHSDKHMYTHLDIHMDKHLDELCTHT